MARAARLGSRVSEGATFTLERKAIKSVPSLGYGFPLANELPSSNLETVLKRPLCVCRAWICLSASGAWLRRRSFTSSCKASASFLASCLNTCGAQHPIYRCPPCPPCPPWEPPPWELLPWKKAWVLARPPWLDRLEALECLAADACKLLPAWDAACELLPAWDAACPARLRPC